MQPPILPAHLPRPLPQARTLQEAVLRIIENEDGWAATRFEAATERGRAPGLVRIISNLIMNAETVEFRERELRQFPYLLTIEDYVWRYGSEWRFDARTIEEARAHSEFYDQIANFRRYTDSHG
jgi:hypothetical protein